MNRGSSRRAVLRGVAGAGSAAGLLTAAACGAPAPGATAPGEARLAPGTRIQFYGTSSDSIFAQAMAPGVAPAVQAWQEKTGIVIENVELGNANYNTRLQVLIASDTAPEVVGVGGSSDPLGSLLLAGAVRALDPYARRDRYDLADFGNSADQYKHRNALWALPLSSNPSAVFFNRDLFSRSGVAPPTASWKAAGWTWSDFLATARSLTTPGAAPEQMVFGAAVADNLKTPTIAVWDYGGDLFDKELTRCTLTSPPAVEALQVMADLVVKHHVNPSPAQLKGMGTDVANLFTEGRIGLLAQGQQLGYGRKLATTNKPAFPWGIAALPKGPAGRYALNIGAAYSLTTGGKQPDAGWELLKFIASPELSRAFIGDGLAAIAPRRSVMAEVLKLPDLPYGYKEVVQYGDALHRLPTIARWSEVAGAISKHFARLWVGDVTVKQVVSDLATELNPLLEPRL
jgi:multiple sugar transport system substrate-binding protein